MCLCRGSLQNAPNCATIKILTGGTVISRDPKRSEGESLPFKFKMWLNLQCKTGVIVAEQQ